VADHLGDWLPAFARRLATTATLPLHVALARLLLQAALALGCADGQDQVRPLEAAPTDTPYECGLAARSDQAEVDA
jgi:TorA maturation chaperone TorD